MSEKKLFVWVDPYVLPYGSTMLIVVADDVESARTLALSYEASRFSFGKFEEDRKSSTLALGDPNRIVELPCAEWHRWEE